jgi:hypothetical protein
MNLHELFTYKGGILFWNVRPLSHFSAARHMNRSNTMWAGKAAGNISSPKNQNRQSYIFINTAHKVYMAHRVVWEMHNGEIKDGYEIDHINGIGTDNRIENLRIVSHSENMKNLPTYKNNKSGTTGVSWQVSSGKWIVTIRSNGKNINLGRYESIEEAKTVREEANIKYKYHNNHGRI